MKYLVALALLVVGCRDKDPAAALTGVTRGFSIPKATKQLIVVVVDDWTTTHGQLSWWQRGARWDKQDEWPVVIGRGGTAWGIGLAPTRPGPVKKEGDGKSPAGVFALRTSYGYADEAPKGWKMPYESAIDLECIDDPGSDNYARIIDRKQVPSDWQSAELMRREDDLYTWVIDVAHNPDHKPGAGSCIFLHVWGGPESTTSGCTAMDKPKLESLLAKLDPASQPLFVLLPRAEYRAVADAWALPAL